MSDRDVKPESGSPRLTRGMTDEEYLGKAFGHPSCDFLLGMAMGLAKAEPRHRAMFRGLEKSRQVDLLEEARSLMLEALK